MVYILGAVKHPCIYVLEKRETITVYQALALAGGLSETAKASGAKVIRWHDDGSAAAEVPIDIHKMLRGVARDIELGPNDILFIPDSRPPRPPQPRLPPGDPILHNFELSRGALCPLVANSWVKFSEALPRSWLVEGTLPREYSVPVTACGSG